MYKEAVVLLEELDRQANFAAEAAKTNLGTWKERIAQFEQYFTHIQSIDQHSATMVNVLQEKLRDIAHSRHKAENDVDTALKIYHEARKAEVEARAALQEQEVALDKLRREEDNLREQQASAFESMTLAFEGLLSPGFTK